MASLDINDTWHIYSQWTYRQVVGTFTVESNGLNIFVSFTGTQYSTYEQSGSGYPATNNCDTIFIELDNGDNTGTTICSEDIDMFSDQTINISNSSEYVAGNHTFRLYIQCGDYKSCPYDYYNDPCELGALTVEARVPHQQPSISLSLPSGVSNWTKQGSGTSIHCDWNRNGDPHSHNINLKRGGSGGTDIYNQDSGDESGSFNQDYTTPTTRDSKYTIWAKITDKNDGSYNATTSYERGVWGLPNISVSLENSNKIIVNTTNMITVSVDSLVNDNGSPEKVWIDVNGEVVKTWDNLSTGISYTGSNALTYNYTPTVDGQTYIITAYVEHSYSGEKNNASTSFKTYVTPVLSDITGKDIFSPQDLATYSWTNNANDISAKNETPSQKITISNSSKTDVVDNNTSINLAPSGTYWVQSIFSDNVRSTNVLSSTLTVKFTNSDSGVSVSKDKQFQVQYQPTQNITDISVENQGRTIAIDADASTTVQWKYPWDAGSAGVVSGFRVRVYSDSSYSTLVSTREVSVTYADFITGPTYSIDLDNETDLQRGVMNYADITPYYIYPSDGTKSYGPVVQIGQLIKPYKYMAKPIIEYPINNKIWHNNGFRVLFRLNVDGDYGTYTTDIKNNYKYSDVEIKVNNTIYSFSGTYTGSTPHPEIFSTDVNKANTNNYQKYMAINPSLVSGFPDVADGGNFKIQIRVQRGNYYFTNSEMRGYDSLGTAVKTWSEWSDEIILNKSSIAPQNLAVGMEIKASHYQTVHNWGLRLLSCYPLRNRDVGDVDQARGDQIDGSKTQIASGSDEYEAVFRTMQNLMAGVNGYCTYDRAPVKFNSNPTFSALEEIITSAESGTDRYGSTGRNYMNLLTRYMNNYLK